MAHGNASHCVKFRPWGPKFALVSAAWGALGVEVRFGLGCLGCSGVEVRFGLGCLGCLHLLRYCRCSRYAGAYLLHTAPRTTTRPIPLPHVRSCLDRRRRHRMLDLRRTRTRPPQRPRPTRRRPPAPRLSITCRTCADTVRRTAVRSASSALGDLVGLPPTPCVAPRFAPRDPLSVTLLDFRRHRPSRRGSLRELRSR